mmetsp:Transcript_59613/g.129065  ORF Transcript_59613/g.129065 Transcript_59613/m.129065 type:complete len:295 (-) Transcript_59613:243-1127(-)
MGFKDEPLGSLFRSFSGSTDIKEKLHGLEDDRDVERAFEIADFVEQGLARELVSEFMQPLRRSSKLWRFQVIRSENKLEHRLYSDGGDFLMFARTCVEAQKIELFLYDPSVTTDRLYDPSRPAFTMTFNKARTEWRIVQERCENCQFLPKQTSCACLGKQQVALIRHSRLSVGEGIFNCMEVVIPGLYSDGSRVVWCPLLQSGDLAMPLEGYETQQLITKRPAWNDEVESLVLDFKGRRIVSSAKNFQISLRQKPEHVLCQYGKIGTNTFSLDFKYPLSVIQAFGASLTTTFWT